MVTIINAWLSVWLYVMAAIGIGLCHHVYKNRKAWDKISVFCTLAIIVLILHVIEEWAIPGGLHYSYNINHGSMFLSKYPMNRLTDMITNFGAVVLGCIVLKIWGFGKSAGIAIMLFSAAEAVMHICIGIQDMKIFGVYGMNTVYSPGLVTSLFGFLPISIGLAIKLFRKKENRPKLRQWAMGVAAIGVLGFLLINLPEMIFSSCDTPYEFTDRGFYEQYGRLYEQDNGVHYFYPESDEVFEE